MATFARINQDIRAPELRVIDEQGNQLGILPRMEALGKAQELSLDLVEISPNANPPVAKIVNWGKYQYQQSKKLKKNQRQAKSYDLKQMRMGLKISDHDLGVKLKKVTGFLEAGHKVKIFIVYKGRELAHKELGNHLATRVIGLLGDSISVDQSPVFAGRQLSFVVRSKNAKKA